LAIREEFYREKKEQMEAEKMIELEMEKEKCVKRKMKLKAQTESNRQN
jgi:CCR4-NOT transcriptional regulation complex NOT5 subunit